VQVFVLRVWFVVIVIGICVLVLAPFTYFAQQILREVQERVNPPPSSTSIAQSVLVPIPFGIAEEPVALPDGLNQTMASGDAHTCVVTRTAFVLCWGDNAAGQLGVGVAGDSVAQSSISPVVGLTDVTSIAVGSAHSCAVRAPSGSVWCWGDNRLRQLGGALSGPQTSRAIAAQVITIPAVQQLVSGSNHACILSQQGDVWCWGDNQYGQVARAVIPLGSAPARVEGLPSDVVALRSGTDHVCALTQQGTLWCWGRNHVQQIDDSTDDVILNPRQIYENRRVTQLGLARDTTCIMFESQQLECRAVSAQPSVAMVDSRLVSASLGQQCLVSPEFTSTCWDAVTPPQSQDVTGVAFTTSGADFQCVLLRAGLVQCRGDNQKGQIGVAERTVRVAEFVFVGLGSSNDNMAAGYAHVCTIWQLGKVLCWGRNLEGQVGLPVQDSVQYRAAPNDIGINGVTHLATSGNHTCVIRFDGRVSCWGLNDAGQLGLGHATNRHVPELISSLKDVAQITLGLNHSCALQRDGQVFCWGDNRFGQITGSTSTSQQLVPIRVTAVEDVVKIAAGGNT
jgi:alpha-tubulin suppressor-like RCC1 family protein